MHPHLDAALSRLDESRAALRAAVEAVPAALRTRKPAQDRWSVAEVLEHLPGSQARSFPSRQYLRQTCWASPRQATTRWASPRCPSWCQMGDGPHPATA